MGTRRKGERGRRALVPGLEDARRGGQAARRPHGPCRADPAPDRRPCYIFPGRRAARGQVPGRQAESPLATKAQRILLKPFLKSVMRLELRYADAVDGGSLLPDLASPSVSSPSVSVHLFASPSVSVHLFGQE